jgi:hypothetical protein
MLHKTIFHSSSLNTEFTGYSYFNNRKMPFGGQTEWHFPYKKTSSTKPFKK